MDVQCLWHFNGQIKIKYQNKSFLQVEHALLINTWQNLEESGKVAAKRENTCSCIVHWFGIFGVESSGAIFMFVT